MQLQKVIWTMRMIFFPTEKLRMEKEKQGTCGKGVNWTLKDGILTISGNGEMDDFYVVADFFYR